MAEPFVINAELKSSAQINAGLNVGIPGMGGTPYDGPYAVTPATYREQVLATKNRSMREDVTVGKIPVYEVSNVTGGLTLTIGIESLGG